MCGRAANVFSQAASFGRVARQPASGKRKSYQPMKQPAAMEALGRNPEAADKIFTPLILSLAFTEAIGIYALVVALIIKFV